MDIEREKVVQKMANLLRKGATMLQETCPIHNVPLFKLKTGEIVCPACGKRVIILKEGEEHKEVQVRTALGMEQVLFEKLRYLTYMLSEEKEPEKIREILVAINECLTVLERLKKIGIGV